MLAQVLADSRGKRLQIGTRACRSLFVQHCDDELGLFPAAISDAYLIDHPLLVLLDHFDRCLKGHCGYGMISQILDLIYLDLLLRELCCVECADPVLHLSFETFGARSTYQQKEDQSVAHKHILT